jgi:hypothetical protein
LVRTSSRTSSPLLDRLELIAKWRAANSKS